MAGRHESQRFKLIADRMGRAERDRRGIQQRMEQGCRHALRAGVPNPKFALLCSALRANSGFDKDTGHTCNSKIVCGIRIRTRTCGNDGGEFVIRGQRRRATEKTAESGGRGGGGGGGGGGWQPLVGSLPSSQQVLMRTADRRGGCPGALIDNYRSRGSICGRRSECAAHSATTGFDQFQQPCHAMADHLKHVIVRLWKRRQALVVGSSPPGS